MSQNIDWTVWRLRGLRWLAYGSWVLLALLAYLTIAMAQIRFSVQFTGSGMEVWALCKPAIYLISQLMPNISLSGKEGIAIQTEAIEFLLVLIVVVMSILPVFHIPYSIQRATLRRPLKINSPVDERARNRIMLMRYRDAASAIVFAGCFDWLLANQDLTDQVIKMA